MKVAEHMKVDEKNEKGDHKEDMLKSREAWGRRDGSSSGPKRGEEGEAEGASLQS